MIRVRIRVRHLQAAVVGRHGEAGARAAGGGERLGASHLGIVRVEALCVVRHMVRHVVPRVVSCHAIACGAPCHAIACDAIACEALSERLGLMPILAAIVDTLQLLGQGELAAAPPGRLGRCARVARQVAREGRPR